MIVTVIPRGQSIVGVLPKNKPINGEMTLDLNEREINYCMSRGDVYDENGVLLTSYVEEKYTGASNTITRIIPTPDKLKEIQDENNKDIPLALTVRSLYLSEMNYEPGIDRNTILIQYTHGADDENDMLYGVITSKGRNINFQMCDVKTLELGKKIGSKFAEFTANEDGKWAIEVVSNNPQVDIKHLNLTVQIKNKSTNKTVLSEDFFVTLR